MNGMIYFTNQTNMFSDNNDSYARDKRKKTTPSKNHRFASDEPSRLRLINNLTEGGVPTEN
jgi:hypothetical protein